MRPTPSINFKESYLIAIGTRTSASLEEMAGGDAAKAEKIRLSVSDFRYVYDEINTRAQELMRLHFPDKSSDDPLIDGVAHEVQRFINEVFETARHSIIVEDAPHVQVPITELLENAPSGIEPFDLELNKRKRELSALADARTIEVTELRKTQPVRLRERYKQLVQERQQRLTSTAAQVREANTEAAGSPPPALELEDRDETSNEFNELVQRLNVLREVRLFFLVAIYAH